ncbi:MAG TPA: hypothetical protein VHZ95_12475 [Polyangiales bacterium]|nr:hypothetical protein [Polyangiales bacterium]
MATSDGALLIWAPATACKTGLLVQRLGADGSAPRAPIAIDPACGGGEIVEVAAASGGGRLGIAFIVEDKGARRARVLGTYASDSGEAFAPVLPLGAAEPTGRAARGRLELVATESGQMRIGWQAPRAACVGDTGSCAQILSEPYPPPSDPIERRTDTREIPQPCERFLTGSVWTGGVWYDGFCALDRSSVPTTQVYSIRPEISYAEVDPTLQDCEPLGLSPSAAGAVAWGRCADGLAAHFLAPEGRRQIVRNAERTLECAEGRPSLRLHGSQQTGEALPLRAPRDRLEGWLPASLASDDARAAFTGRDLLVAAPEAGHLVVTSHHCESQRLVSDVGGTRPML